MATNAHGRSLPHGNIVLLGHAGHGKSTLLRALAARLRDRPDGYARAFADPLAPTVHPRMEELETPQRRWSLLDVPGHRRYLREAIREAAAVDVAVLVVSAVAGAEAQTREHLLHARGAPNLVVFLNRCDEVAEPDWIDEVERDVRQVIASCDLPGDDVLVLRGSALRALEGDARWGHGVDALLEALDRDVTLPTRDDEGPGVLLVKASYRRSKRDGAVTGVIAAGIVLRGALSVNGDVELVGRGPTRRVKIDRMETHGRPVASARAGDCVGVMLRGVTAPWRLEGVAVAPRETQRAAAGVTARVRLLTKAEGGRHHPMVDGHRMQLCVGAAKVPCTLRLLKERLFMPGETQEVALELDQELVLSTWRHLAVERFTAWAEPGLAIALRDGCQGITAMDGALVWGGTCAVGTVTGVRRAG